LPISGSGNRQLKITFDHMVGARQQRVSAAWRPLQC